ncbi:hypothetical protein Glove_327g6 [Diversispora epigaea]|uniref:Uncharacterized protein n=1 Tax=Diversispora epigaea TaxID=1348612 RepID=A0A397HPG3_9GLOM|nr:hypothetical protein Glove_327g6 [Diversispora epigaea]
MFGLECCGPLADAWIRVLSSICHVVLPQRLPNKCGHIQNLNIAILLFVSYLNQREHINWSYYEFWNLNCTEDWNGLDGRFRSSKHGLKTYWENVIHEQKKVRSGSEEVEDEKRSLQFGRANSKISISIPKPSKKMEGITDNTTERSWNSNPDRDKYNDRKKLFKEGIFALNKFITRTDLPSWETYSHSSIFTAQIIKKIRSFQKFEEIRQRNFLPKESRKEASNKVDEQVNGTRGRGKGCGFDSL